MIDFNKVGDDVKELFDKYINDLDTFFMSSIVTFKLKFFKIFRAVSSAISSVLDNVLLAPKLSLKEKLKKEKASHEVRKTLSKTVY